ncbi:ATP synthase subunit I [Thiohalomonas denitrificans]|uniref:ATP synthase subunit I n=1 Tax=Thiohalomonas denitrificans TaxID=415747 RepID=UPI0026F1684C|nr:ATP synthase subunit I [Thiohalomonas denitrificans]
MSYAAKVLLGMTRRLLTIQALLVLLAAGVYLALRGWEPVSAVVFGGAIALFNTLISAQRLARASDSANQDPKRGMMELFTGAVIRIVATPALIAIGIVFLDLNPVAIIVGFGVAQVGYFFNSAHPHLQKPNS